MFRLPDKTAIIRQQSSYIIFYSIHPRACVNQDLYIKVIKLHVSAPW
jgi:hypothetical protein